eukprot:CAMPEP_0184520766 /NCGR_PEP_ID=MMETSP0198_2-20121128/7350_1 /TAXON_ID=1112570 /ORGANISM="Thraustochytrium sp., Strain LLF1b" /LENGTH=510 /DNA_ID=CAMNT_0026911401 /DNA_START=179 /DNA_END=1711 /DNA_ORIENTATION=-
MATAARADANKFVLPAVAVASVVGAGVVYSLWGSDTAQEQVDDTAQAVSLAEKGADVTPLSNDEGREEKSEEEAKLLSTSSEKADASQASETGDATDATDATNATNATDAKKTSSDAERDEDDGKVLYLDANPVMTSEFTYFTGKTLKDPSRVSVFSGSGNVALAESIAQFLGVSLGDMNVSKFADGEVSIKVNQNVRGKHVVLIQSCSSPNVNDALVELLLMISTMRRSSAKTITVVMPYCAYSRSDMTNDQRMPIAARDTMTMLETMGMDRLVVMDMHSAQVQGFLSPNVPSDNVSAIKVAALYMSEIEELRKSQNLVVVAPSPKSVGRAKDFWNVLLQRDMPARFAMVLRKPALGDLARKEQGALAPVKQSNREIEYEVVGDDSIQDSVAIIIEDILDSGELVCGAADALKHAGASKVYAFATHGLFTEGSTERLKDSGLDRVLVTNTAVCPEEARSVLSTDKVEWITVAPILAETIRRLCEKETLSPLFKMPAARNSPHTSETSQG